MTDKFTFKYENEEGKEITFILKKEELEGWSSVLQDFLYFLEGVGFVGVLEKVQIKYSPFLAMDGWHGGVFDKEDEDIFAWEQEYEEEDSRQLDLFKDNANPSNS